MSSEENKALVRRWLDHGWQAEDTVAMMDEIWAEDVVIHYPHVTMDGLDQLKRHVVDTKAALQDPVGTTRVILAEGDKVAYHCTFSATHAGEFMGIAPTGKRITITATGIARVANGKIVEVFENFDSLGLMKQSGAV